MKNEIKTLVLPVVPALLFSSALAWNWGNPSSENYGSSVRYDFGRHMNQKCKAAINSSIAVDQQRCAFDARKTRFHDNQYFTKHYRDGVVVNVIPMCHWEVRCKKGIWGIAGDAIGSGTNYASQLVTVARCDDDYSKVEKDCTPVTEQSFKNRQAQQNPWLAAFADWWQANGW